MATHRKCIVGVCGRVVTATCIAAAVLFSLTALSAEFRTWTSVNGDTVEAQLLSAKGDRVVLKKRSGKLVRIPRESLSAADKTFLLRMVAAADDGGNRDPIEYAAPAQVCLVTNVLINESSGVSASWSNQGMFWTHNDSGDTPRLFLIDGTGKVAAWAMVKKAGARDWEDIASFQFDGKEHLLIGDVGDNAEKRQECRLYLLEEPSVEKLSRGREAKARVSMAIPFRYDDGMHNCESIGVDGKNKMIYVVSKKVGQEICKVYEMPLPAKEPKKPLVAKAIATLEIPTTTAMDMSVSGIRAVVLTYGNAYEYTRARGESWAEAFSKEPRVLKMPRRKQGESICYGTDGKTLYLTSEGVSQPLWEIKPVSK